MKKIIVILCAVFALLYFFDFTDYFPISNIPATSNNDATDYMEDVNNDAIDYIKAVENEDFENAHKCLRKLYSSYTEESSVDISIESWGKGWSYSSRKNAQTVGDAIIASADGYTKAASYVFCAEVRYLMSQPDESLNDKIVYLFNEFSIVGDRRSEGDAGSHYGAEGVNAALLKKYIACNNQIAFQVIDMAINAGNKKLAAIGVSHIMNTFDLTNDDKYHFSTASKEEAQAKFDEAVKNGLFN